MAQLANDGELRLKRPPTGMCSFNGKLYISTKGKRVFFCEDGAAQLKSILFSAQVDALAASDEMLYCASNDGNIFGLSSSHKVLVRAHSDASGATHCLYDIQRSNLCVGTANGKVLIFSDGGILRDTFYCGRGRLDCFDIAPGGVLGAAVRLSRSICIIDTATHEQRETTVTMGYPSALVFVANSLLAVGTTTGQVYLYKMKPLKLVCTLEVGSAVHALAVVHGHLMVGSEAGSIIVCQASGSKLEVVDRVAAQGMPIAFTSHGDRVAVVLSREPISGRWGRSTVFKNRVVFYKFIEKEQK